MTNPKPDLDPSKQWPEEVRKAYENLKIPSIYDCVLANEKLGVEVHRQGHEIKEMTNGMQELLSRLNDMMELLAEEFEDYDEDEEEDTFRLAPYDSENLGLNEKSQEILLGTADSLIELSKTTRQLIGQLLEALPKKEGIVPHQPSWYKLVEGLTQSLIEHVDTGRYRFVSNLNEMGIAVIEPQPGDSFEDGEHRVLEKVPGGVPGTIARIVRVGYLQDDIILRQAEVVIYN
jgi:molecular chaperone GrpE (heat shock protein)